MSAMFHKAVVQSVLLCGCETWVITSNVLSVLESLHHRVAPRRVKRHEDLWIYPSITETLQEAGVFTVQEHISRRRECLQVHAETRPIYEACQEAGRGPVPNRRFWWDA